MDFDLLKRLCETPGIPGQEHLIREVVKEALAPLVDSVETDVMGNVIGLKRGNGARKVMLAAHMDEIGFMVRHIDDKGFVRLHPLGGFDARQLFAQRVLVHTRKGEVLRGVLAYSTKPAHMLTPEEMNKAPQIESFFVDLGMSAEQVKQKVSVGDMVTMDRTTECCGDTFFGNVWDGSERYLEIRVRAGASTGAYTTLSPRVKMNPTPYAIWASKANPIGSAGGDLSGTYPNPAVARLQGRAVSTTVPATGQVLKWTGSAWASGTDDTGSGFWQQSGSNIYYTAGNVGIGTNTPASPLHVLTSTAITAMTVHNTADGIAFGVYGVSNSASGIGVFGLANASSGETYGVWGRSASTDGRGVFGWAAATSGTTLGVYGRVSSPDGYAGYFEGRGYFSGDVRVNGTARVKVLEIVGADLAEKFPVSEQNIQPGMVIWRSTPTTPVNSASAEPLTASAWQAWLQARTDSTRA